MSEVATTQTKVDTKVETKEEKKKVEIRAVEHIPFDANVKSYYANTIELAELIDSLFAPMMRDYVGCKVKLNDGSPYNGNVPVNDVPINSLYVSLFFKELENNKDCPIENVHSRHATKGSSMLDSLAMMSGSNSGRVYDVTPETYEALDKFRFFSNRKANWNMLTREIVSSFGYTTSMNQEIVCEVTGLSLDKILNEVYGTRTAEGVFQYQAVPVQIVANVNGEYVVQVTQLDIRKLEDLRKSLGGPVMRSEFHEYVR